ncbi:30S ribosomal protein S4 [Candidatus Bathyarchaeota archaeon]|nr:30S ribosomal protein S4 [Candidatus Bathyarchaeota archaeon]
MGDPKKQRKKYETPKFPWQTDVLQEELKLLGQYGLRNKRELWRHKTMLSRFRGIARSLLGMSSEERKRQEKQLLGRLVRLGILPKKAALDNVFDLALENVLERRLQTLVFRKGLANSTYQARQLITHGHVAIEGRRVSSPSYLVMKEEEAKIAYAPASPLSTPDHPLRESLAGGAEMKPETKGEVEEET